MKVIKILKTVTAVLFMAAAISCGSTSVDSSNDDSKNQAPSVKDSEFIESLANYKINLIQTPKAADYNKPFATSFIVQVKNKSGAAVPNFPITIEYPSSKEKGKVVFTTKNVTTDNAGKVLFKPENTDFSVKSECSFYPTPVSNKKSTVNAAKEAGVKANFVIKSKLISSGAILFIWEYNEKGKPATNCYTVLSELQTRGATAGNAPINQESMIGAANDVLYTRNKAIVENNFGYLICGTVKYVNPVQKNDDKTWTCSLVSEIYVIDMNNGKEIYRKTYSADATDAKYEKSISEARKVLAKVIVDNLVDNL